jgi:WD40 repeat protein
VDAPTVTASDDTGRTYLWDANTAKRMYVLEPLDGSVVSCSVFSFGGGVLASELLVTGDRGGRVDAVAISVGGRLLATAGTGNAIHLWDAATGVSLGTISDPGGRGVNSLAFSVIGTQLAVADKNGTTYVWSLAD